MEAELPYSGTPTFFAIDDKVDVRFKSVRLTGQFIFTIVRKGEDLKFYNDLHSKHLAKYSKHPHKFKIPLSNITPLLMVVVTDSETQEEFRGQVYEGRDENGNVLVMNVDEGEAVICKASDLHYISKEYLALEFNSFMCYLDGLTFFEGTSIMRTACELIQHELSSSDMTAKCAGYHEGLPVFKLRTSEGEMVHKSMLDFIVEACPAWFPNCEDRSKYATISNIESTGLTYLHMKDSFVFEMEKQMSKMLTAADLKRGSEYVANHGVIEGQGHIYLAPYEEQLYRCNVEKIIGVPGCGTTKARVRFIDYGNHVIVSVGEMMAAAMVDRTLVKIPALAIPVYLKWIKVIIDVDAFMTRHENKLFRIEVRNAVVDEKYTVNLLILAENGKEYYSLNKLMIEQELALKGT